MTKGRPAQHTASPIYQLRKLIGETSPVTQPELARIIDVPFATVQSIEAGRRGITGATLEKIALGTGAYWDQRKTRWMCIVPDENARNKPFDRKEYLAFRRTMTQTSLNDKDELPDILKKVEQLFDKVPDDHRYMLYLRLLHFIEKCHHDFHTSQSTSIKPELGQKQNPNLGVKRLYGTEQP
jgi:transcriptional regulator with XRE-family HTH domain